LHIEDGEGEGDSFSTLETICKALDCQPGDIFGYVHDDIKTVSINGAA
jgi:DNA-binding Xre family transcriptional regulator